MIKVQAQDSVPGLGLRRGAGDGNRTRTISLGMSAGMALTSAAAGGQSHWLVREYPRSTLSDRPIGHVAGTPVPSMRTLARMVDTGRCRWSADEAWRAWTLTGVLAAARVAAPGLPCLVEPPATIRSVECFGHLPYWPTCPLTWWNAVHRCAAGGNVERRCAAKIRPARAGDPLRAKVGRPCRTPGLTQAKLGTRVPRVTATRCLVHAWSASA